MDKVKVELQCPFCGYCGTVKVPSHRKAVNCRECWQAVFLRRPDEEIAYYRATEPFATRRLNAELEQAFGEVGVDG